MEKGTIHRIRREINSLDSMMTPDVRRIGRKYFREVKGLPKNHILDICQELLDSGTWAERIIAFQWAFQLRKRYEKEDFNTFERWLKAHVTGWSSCDDLCTHAMGELLHQFPELLPKVKEWTSSENMWKRRGAAVTMVYPIRRGKYLEVVFEIADSLFHDDEELVLKGYGWMLKEASVTYRREVYDYVMKNRATMPRTALRYALEKMPEHMRKKAMETSL